ncbi:hypothetical protein Dsin_008258 [Dipteronia sinensis]|uniref:Uncharacterized protein n=1 Tax=Dipteronia sinensis TaxID=43782 RepID=A0AAE0ANC4_9ROSI|nr:hypothetical protein Dsin_008258 [Dipteronia sinensis]
MSKGIIVFGLCMLLACTFFVSEAKYIDYVAIGQDVNPGCGPKHPELCTEGPPANNYNRGCEAEEKCRSG